MRYAIKINCRLINAHSTDEGVVKSIEDRYNLREPEESELTDSERGRLRRWSNEEFTPLLTTPQTPYVGWIRGTDLMASLIGTQVKERTKLANY